VTGEILFDEFAELPPINYERDAGLDYAMKRMRPQLLDFGR
jgi:hypothetical protein